MNEAEINNAGVLQADGAVLDDPHGTARMLELAIVQIETAVEDADASVMDMIASVTTMARSIQKIERDLRRLPDDDQYQWIKASIHDHCEVATGRMDAATRAFQFYDKLTQRFSHVRGCLEELARLILLPQQHDAALWERLKEKIRSVYSLQQEQAIFKALMEKATDEVMNEEAGQKQKGSSAGSIDLF